MAILVLLTAFEILCHTVICAIGLFIGFFGLMMSIGEDIQRKFYFFNENYKIDRNDYKLKEELRDIIYLHLEIKE